MKLHKGLTFRNENALELSEDGSLLVKPIGNATEGQEVTIQYCVKLTEELKKLTDVNFSKVKELPFQAQISYYSLDGAKCVRLITKKQSVTFEKEQAKKGANYQVISVHAIQKTAFLAEKGDYRGAQANFAHWKKLIKGSAEYKSYIANVKPLYEALEKQQVEDFMKTKSCKSDSLKSKGGVFAKKEVAYNLGSTKAQSNDLTVSSLSRARKFNSKRMDASSKK
jgi:hypothetical protein